MTRRPVQWLMVGLVIALVVAALFLWRWGNLQRNPQPVPVPTAVAGLVPDRVSYGREAVAEVRRLHGLSFPLTGGGVAVYGSDGQATVWAAGTPLPLMASRLVTDMEARIGEGNSPFAPLSKRSLDGRTVYELSGMGQHHFYFQAGSWVIWLAADREIAEQAFQQTLAFYLGL